MVVVALLALPISEWAREQRRRDTVDRWIQREIEQGLRNIRPGDQVSTRFFPGEFPSHSGDE
jgi:hypothetical protein